MASRGKRSIATTTTNAFPPSLYPQPPDKVQPQANYLLRLNCHCAFASSFVKITLGTQSTKAHGVGEEVEGAVVVDNWHQKYNKRQHTRTCYCGFCVSSLAEKKACATPSEA